MFQLSMVHGASGVHILSVLKRVSLEVLKHEYARAAPPTQNTEGDTARGMELILCRVTLRGHVYL